MDPRTLRSTFGRFATGVTVVTCRTPDGAHHGATVTAFTPISLDPPLVQVALTRTSRAAAFLDGAAFAVNVLADDQVDVAMHFAGRPSPDPLPWAAGSTAPTLRGTAATVVCRPWRTDDGGDHLLFLGEIVEVHSTGRRPLLFSDSSFHHLGDRSSDVVWLGCQDDPHTGWFGAPVPADTHY
ncbi:flavin reductase family protein [Pimelobacter simplex]|uniref:Flavin reductase family protein n=1 Tax=Nocardioides simplex TaxID=2045 RepID=A0A0A1DRA5_NOCSI|nr:flavin reductase family protein [Pimelobacter simplex]AIY19137.1 Nitrilotriacetate monooxygenase component B [Pimelobacter simplex]KAB2812518.1 flavin reductase family protein [Pimelobacter simplex]MCG8149168.1 flavin reductase [Pimelobacter simplex]SFM22621.1 NADH-FMN oxidoreductase RutF, flavin reductase (DIM6/NTAB) family [Pimelobacter simplex]GEB14968.1 flavin reductase [Pimelobacter simplex]